jgi:hypothetical protein
MVQLVIAIAVIVVAIGVGLVLRRRQVVDAPTQPVFEAPTQLDRADFPAAGADQWLVVVFSSAACTTCADVVRKAAVLESRHVAVVDAEYGRARDLHTKYHIDGVPIVVIADQAGVVRRSFVGPVSATDLWAAVATARG